MAFLFFSVLVVSVIVVLSFFVFVAYNTGRLSIIEKIIILRTSELSSGEYQLPSTLRQSSYACFDDVKQISLQNRLDALSQDYKKIAEDIISAIDPVTKNKLKRKIDQIENEIRLIEDDLRQLEQPRGENEP